MKINFVVVALLTFFSGFAQEINKAQLKCKIIREKKQD